MENASSWICLHVSVFCVHHVMCVYLSTPHGDTAESQPRSPSMLCYRQAAIYNNQLISQWVVPDSQPLLHFQTQTLPSHSHTLTQTHGALSRRRNIYFFVPLLDMCSEAVDHPVWLWDRKQICLIRQQVTSVNTVTLKGDYTCARPPLSTVPYLLQVSQ